MTKKEDLHYNLGLLDAVALALPAPTTAAEHKVTNTMVMLLNKMKAAYTNHIADLNEAEANAQLLDQISTLLNVKPTQVPNLLTSYLRATTCTGGCAGNGLCCWSTHVG